jgi:uncharacterized protein (TIGR00369 family)
MTRAENEAEVLRRANGYIEYIKTEKADCITAKMPCEIAGISFDEKYVTYSFETKEWMLNPGGVLHGGITCTMFDIAMGVTARCFSGYYSPTVNLSVTYLCPVPNNDKVLITARVSRLGSTFVQLTAEAKVASSGEMCATASGTFYCNKNKVIVNKHTGEKL